MVSEKSVKNWDDQKLCEDKQKWFFEGDDKAFDVVSNEINQRASIDAEQCEQIGRAWVLNEYELQARTIVLSGSSMFSRLDPDFMQKREYRKYATALSKVYERYGEEIYLEAFRASCESTDPDPTPIALAMLYIYKQGWSNEQFLPKHFRSSRTSRRLWFSHESSSKPKPNFCSEDGKPIVEQRIREMVEVVYNTRPSFSWPKLDRGMSKRAALNDLPKPSHEEPMGDLLALHFCPPAESQDLLSLYFPTTHCWLVRYQRLRRIVPPKSSLEI